MVDDNEMNLKLMSGILSRAGFVVVTAQTGEEALATAQHEVPSAVLMDVTLPTIDGLQATRLMKSDQALASIPVVAVTAWATSEDRERAKHAGCVDFIEKPFRINTLLDVVRRVTDGTG